jgi:hypothetical protein
MPHFVFELTVGRRDHADVNADVNRAANALERFLFQKPQDLRLKARHHLADLIEKDRPAVSRLQ